MSVMSQSQLRRSLKIDNSHTSLTSLDEEKNSNHVIMSINEQRDELKNDQQATQPFFNNQNTILMAVRSCSGDIMLMHETRIFYFSKINHRSFASADYGQAVQHLTNLMLGMLTTRKYRLLTSFYVIWRILDYLMLILLLLKLFSQEQRDELKQDQHFKHFISSKKYHNLAVLSVFALEMFYDVLEYVVKIWFVNRISIYIELVLFALYTFAFMLDGDKHHNIYLHPTSISMTLLEIRFVAFVFERLVDFCIDLELEYDLAEKTIHKLEIPICTKTKHEEIIGLLHVSNRNEIELAKGWNFKGSINVWTLNNAFKCNVPHKQKINPSCYRFVFQFMFVITYCVIAVPFLIIMAVIVCCLALIKLCCRQTSNTILGECFDRYSY